MASAQGKEKQSNEKAELIYTYNVIKVAVSGPCASPKFGLISVVGIHSIAMCKLMLPGKEHLASRDPAFSNNCYIKPAKICPVTYASAWYIALKPDRDDEDSQIRKRRNYGIVTEHYLFEPELRAFRKLAVKKLLSPHIQDIQHILIASINTVINGYLHAVYRSY